METSIIIPFYNSINYLKNNLSHVIQVTKIIDNIEVLYIDDASKDDGYNYIKKRIKNNKKINLFRLKKNQGPGIARNYGINKAIGRKLLFLDVDDKFNILNLKLFLKKYKNSKKNFFFNYKVKPLNKNFFKNNPINKNKRINLSKYLLETNDKSIIFSCLYKNFVLRNKIYFPKGFHEDIIFKFKLLYYSKPFINFNKIIYIKNDNKNSITGRKFSKKNLIGFINAWKDVGKFIKRKKLSYLNNDYQFRLRGEYINLYKIIEEQNKEKKNQ